MDLLLTHAYYLEGDAVEQAIMRPYPPLGLLYISSHLKRAGLSLEVFDTTFATRRGFAEFVARERPPVVGIYANLMTRTRALESMAVCKAAGSLVVLGGPEPVNYPAEYLAHGADIVVAGEGESTLEELIPHLARHGLNRLDEIAGILYLDADGEVARTVERPTIRDLDQQPHPDRGAIDLHLYLDAWKRHHGASSVSLITARGCPFTCNWCSHSVFGFSYRHRSPANVADELEEIRSTYNPDQVWYADDVFTLNKRWTVQFADELDRRGIRIPFETISREDRLDEETVKTLARLGCTRLWVGAESGSQRVLDAMSRGTNALRMREMLQLLKRHGIETGTFIMLGYDGEEWSDLDVTVEHLKASLPDSVLTTISYPIKGTGYYDRIAERSVLPADWASSSDRDIYQHGRRSRRFYDHASRWIRNEVAFERAKHDGSLSMRRLATTLVKAKAGRLGMYLTRHQVESG